MSLPRSEVAAAAWKEPYDRGRAGVYTIPFAEIIQHVEDIVNDKDFEKSGERRR